MADAGQLSPETVLGLTPDLRMRFDASGHLLVDVPNGAVVDAGPRGFAIVSLFAQPTALGEAIAHLERKWTEFAPTMGVVNVLIEEGALVSPGAESAPTRGWADPLEHARMLHDERRTGDFLEAITAAVRPNDVVLDIGTGSGVLAIAAARAGARHVYAVEASDIADVAERVFEVNGVGDRITLVRGWSRRIDLPEPADLLVAEVIGSEPLEEEILETTLDARRRLLKPGARLLPHRLSLFVRPLQIPESDLRQRALGSNAVRRWKQLYGIDFEPLVDTSSQRLTYVPTEGEVAARWQVVGPPVELVTIDLAKFDDASVRASTDVGVTARTEVNALAVTFQAGLHGQLSHTLDPWRWPVSSWATSVWALAQPVRVDHRQALRVEYRHRVSGLSDGLFAKITGRTDAG